MCAALSYNTAKAVLAQRRGDIYVSESTYFYDSGGCC